MLAVDSKTTRSQIRGKGLVLIVSFLIVMLPLSLGAASKKKKSEGDATHQTTESQQALYLKYLDYSKIVWPNPPAVTRVKYMNYFCCEKYVPPTQDKKKTSWMDRMAGGQTEAEKRADKPLFALWTPYGLATDSKGNLYVADGRVGAVFIFNTETKDVSMIKNGLQAHFGFVTGLAMDDNDRLFVADSHYHKIHVFSPKHQFEAAISEGVSDPGGIAIDFENRFLYVADADLDQVLVYDADSYKLLRRLGKTGKNHTLTDEGNFSKPVGVAVDNDGNLFVTDTLNNRVEVFDADGNFIRAFGKAGDGPGTFMRPKGISIDADGHVWVADSMQDRIQCFDQEGHLLMWLGGHGRLPGQFTDLMTVYVDKQNRIFTAEQFPARVQMFRYFTNAEALAEFDKRKKADEEKRNPKSAAQSSKPAEADTKEATATTPQSSAPQK